MMDDPVEPKYLSRLKVRYAKGYNPASYARPIAELREQYKNTSNIRSKYKGARGSRSHTSGIPVFGTEDAAERARWSIGHATARSRLEKKLRSKAGDEKVSIKGVAAENSHALGHGDYGVDHELSAPSASKDQNTEQLAIELGMREAARKLNTAADMPEDESLVHMKITDVLHPTTGHLLVRRLKLIRRSDKDDHEGTVVFDHLMDGERLHLSKKDAFEIGKRAHDALTGGMDIDPEDGEEKKAGDIKEKGKIKVASRSVPTTGLIKKWAPVSLGGKSAQRKGMGGVRAPTKTELETHQEKVLKTLQKNRRDLKKGKRVTDRVSDRRGVDMIGPAFTDARFPTWKNWWPKTETGQAALDRHHAWMQGDIAAEGAGPESLLQSGSLPSGDASKLMKHIATIEHSFGAHLGGVAARIDHDLCDKPDSEMVSAYAKDIDSQFEGEKDGIGSPRNKLQLAAIGARKALNSLEEKEKGSGLQYLNDDQKQLLMAAHIYADFKIGEHKPVLSEEEDE